MKVTDKGNGDNMMKNHKLFRIEVFIKNPIKKILAEISIIVESREIIIVSGNFVICFDVPLGGKYIYINKIS